ADLVNTLVEIVGVVFMIVAGGAIAVLIMIVIAVAQRNADPSMPVNNVPDRTRLAASILFHLLLQGGTAQAEALRKLRSVGLIAPVTAGIDLASWSERYAHVASPAQRAWLLETAVQLVSAAYHPVPLRQYAALLDLSFSLGFQTDALAKLREQYGFDYVDHAKHGRPREADRAGGAATTFFVRDRRDTHDLLRVLEIDVEPTRQAIIAPY